MKLRSASKIYYLIAVFAVFFILPGTLQAQIVINEFFPDPAGTDTGLEWIEIYNAGSQSQDLTGWQINGSGKYFTFPSLSLAAKTALLIRWRADGQNTANEIFTGTAAVNTNISNSSGFLALFDSAEHNKDTLRDYLEYGKAGQSLEATAVSAGIWQKEQFLAAAGENQTLGLKKDGQDSNSASDWEIHTLTSTNETDLPNINTGSGTDPQQENQAQIDGSAQNEINNASSSQTSLNNFSDKIFINEFMPWPAGNQKEWVEIINTGTTATDLSSWEIDDEPDESQPQEIPGGTVIEPGQILIIELNKNILNNDGDSLRLLWPDGQTIHTVTFTKAKQGISSSRFSNGLWLWTENPTPGAANKKSTPRPAAADKTSDASSRSAAAIAVTLAESVKEPVSEPAQNQPVQQNDPEQPPVASSSIQAQARSLAPAETAAQTPDQNIPRQTDTGASPLLALGGVLLLSSLASAGLIYFKKKTFADNRQKPI